MDPSVECSENDARDVSADGNSLYEWEMPDKRYDLQRDCRKSEMSESVRVRLCENGMLCCGRTLQFQKTGMSPVLLCWRQSGSCAVGAGKPGKTGRVQEKELIAVLTMEAACRMVQNGKKGKAWMKKDC